MHREWEHEERIQQMQEDFRQTNTEYRQLYFSQHEQSKAILDKHSNLVNLD